MQTAVVLPLRKFIEMLKQILCSQSRGEGASGGSSDGNGTKAGVAGERGGTGGQPHGQHFPARSRCPSTLASASASSRFLI